MRAKLMELNNRIEDLNSKESEISCEISKMKFFKHKGECMSCLKICQKWSEALCKFILFYNVGDVIWKTKEKWENLSQYLSLMKRNIIDECVHLVSRTESDITDIRAKIRERDTLFKEHWEKFREYTYKLEDHIQFTTQFNIDYQSIKKIANKLDQNSVQK